MKENRARTFSRKTDSAQLIQKCFSILPVDLFCLRRMFLKQIRPDIGIYVGIFLCDNSLVILYCLIPRTTNRG